MAGVLLLHSIAGFCRDSFQCFRQCGQIYRQLANFILTGGLYIVLTVLFYFIHYLVRWTPLSITNLPNKNYWFAPKRKKSTIEKISLKTIQLGVATNLFIIVVFHLTYLANLSVHRRLNMDMFWTVFAAYMVFVVIWSIGFYRDFRLPDEAKNYPQLRH